MIELTEQQRVEARKENAPVRMTDPATHAEHVLLPVVVYERMRRLLDAEAVDPSLYEFEEIEEVNH